MRKITIKQTKNILLIVLFILISTIGTAQLSFKIENITISHVIEPEIYSIVPFGNGPDLKIECSISNNSSDTIQLLTGSADIYIIFNLDL